MDNISLIRNAFPIKTDLLGKKKLLIFYGPPCAGKTTLSKLVAKKYNISRITMDLIRHEIGWTELHHYNDISINEQLFELMINYIAYVISLNQSIICEALLAADERKMILRELAKKKSYNFQFIYIWAPLEVLLSRLSTRLQIGKNSEGLRKETLDEEILIKFYNLSNPLLIDSVIIDSSIDSVESSLQQIDSIVNL